MKKQDTIAKTIFLIITLMLSAFIPIISAALPPPASNPDYMSVEGLLDTDTYILYPYEEESIDIGFSKYGEMIDGDAKQGLMYKGVDVFANPAVPEDLWCNGWVMDIHYTDGGYLKNVWAYALYSDRTVAGIGGDWQNGQLSEDASAVGDTNGGRRTNGYAESDDIRLIYDGPRKAIYLLKTTIYDKEVEATALVELTIQVVFDKVSKNVMEIKDIKRIDDNKMKGPFQIEFSQRAEWDIGLSEASESYAEFYEDIPTKYDKHPFYNLGDYHGGEDVTVDLVQIIGEEDLVGYAAYWPPLISKWVTNAEEVIRYGGDDPDPTNPTLLSTMETYEQYVQIPADAFDNWPPYANQAGAEVVIHLPRDPVAYPRGMGEWSAVPWVFKKDATGFKRLFYDDGGGTGAWTWHPGDSVHGTIHIKAFQWDWADEFVVVYKRVMEGYEPHVDVSALDCMPWAGFDGGDLVNSYGMHSEPDTPYVFAEWDFDLDMDHPMNSTQQFRCVSVYGVTDNHNAVDPDQPELPGPEVTLGKFRIDKEVVYQIDEIFNPIDLSEVHDKTAFRWAQKGTIGDPILLTAHIDTGAATHVICRPDKWGYYCEESEKVLVYTDSGQVLLEREVDYTFTGDTIDLIGAAETMYDGDLYKVLYSTCQTNPDYHTGQFEWTILGENSQPSDSLGAAMLASGWTDWKNIEVWLSGLDVDAAMAPAIPVTMRKFADTETPNRLNYHYDHAGGDHRAAFRDDWCTPDDWSGAEIHPKAISSSDLIIVGGPLANEAAMYFNDFTDALIFTNYGDGFYGPGCWARTTQDHYQENDFVDVVDDELWYNSVTVDDDVGHAIVSVYKDLNETVGFVVYGYTAEDTYYACAALRGGLIAWNQELQAGVTSLIIEIDYSDLHPVTYHVKESLGRFTECTGFDTDFKCMGYELNYDAAKVQVKIEASDNGIMYKYVDIEWCAQLHPDP